MTPNDADLVATAVRGDHDALGKLLKQHGPPIEAKLRIGSQWREALESSDVMQVTYLEAFFQIRNFDPVRAALFPAWLRQIAENNLRDAIRGLEAQKSLPPAQRVAAYGDGGSAVGLFEDLTAGCGTPSRAARAGEAREALHAAIARLPADYATAVRLYDLEGKSIDEVATAMARSAGAVHMIRLRAHDRLRALLGSASRVLDSTV